MAMKKTSATIRIKKSEAKWLAELIETFTSYFENMVDAHGMAKEAMSAVKGGAGPKQVENICRRYLADAFCESLRLTAEAQHK